jgi:hypothetical protein
MGLLEHFDDKFVSDIQNPARRKKLLRGLLFLRSLFLFGAAIQLIPLAMSMSYQSSITWTFGTMLAIYLTSYIACDTRIKMIKLAASTHQESSDNNTPKYPCSLRILKFAPTPRVADPPAALGIGAFLQSLAIIK